MNTVPDKSHSPDISAPKVHFRTLSVYLFLVIIPTLVLILFTLTMFEIIPAPLSLRLNNFEQLVNSNQYENARIELNKMNEEAGGSLEDSTKTAINQILATKFTQFTDQILQEKSGFRIYQLNTGLTLFQNELYPIVESELQKVTKAYLDSGTEYEEISYYLQNLERLGFENTARSYQSKLNTYYQSHQDLADANLYFAAHDYLKAIPLYRKIIPVAEKDFQEAQEKIKTSYGSLLPEYLAKAASLAKEQRYKEAYDVLQTISELYPDKPELLAKLAEYKKAQSMTVYQGPIEHIFFHPLIAYPELAFDQDNQAKGFNDWFVTVKEFNKLLDSLYKNNYILVDIHSVFTKPEKGNPLAIRKDLLLPAGKKPLILSIDDLNYYKYMIQNGTVHKLILDENSNIATYSLSPQGVPTISHDNEIIPILDKFVREHEDFSLNGAKGVIALTGYEGVLGYRTNELDSPNFTSEKNQALIIIKRLKETGWTFASHGYGHLDARKNSLAILTKDTQRWLTEVAPFTGPTDVYIYPFGSSVLPGDPKFQLLLDNGFQVLCSVGPNPYLKSGPDYLMMDRRHIDGISLHSQAASLKGFFESSEIIDPVRPAFLP